MTARRKTLFWSAALGSLMAMNLGTGMTDAVEAKAKTSLKSRIASTALKGRCATQCKEVVINKSGAILKNCVQNCRSEVERLLKTLETRLTDKQDQKGERGIDKLKEDITKKQKAMDSLKGYISGNESLLKELKSSPNKDKQKIKNTENQLRNQRNEKTKREKELKKIKALEKAIENKNAKLDREIATLTSQTQKIKTALGQPSGAESVPPVPSSIPEGAGKETMESITPSHPSSAPSRLPPALPKGDHAPYTPSKKAAPLPSTSLPPPSASHIPASAPPPPPPLPAPTLTPAPSGPSAATPPNRANLLAQIQGGTSLRKVDEVDAAQKKPRSSQGLVNEEMLARRRSMKMDDDETLTAEEKAARDNEWK